MRLLLSSSFAALGVTLAVAFVACGGDLATKATSSDAAAPSNSDGEGRSTGEGPSVDCDAACPTLPKPSEQQRTLCADGTLAPWTCGPVGAWVSQECAFFGKCQANAQQCFLASTLGPENQTISPDGGLVGQVNPSLRACTEASDCTSVEVTDDCCGTIHVAGVNKQHAATLTACAATRKAGYGSCQCPAATYADDRTMAGASESDAGEDAGAARMTCRFNQCTTTFLP